MRDEPSKSRRAQRHLPIAGSYNIRDLGGYRSRGGETLAWRRFLRADSLHRLTPEGIGQLLDEGLSMVIDLRTPDEMADARNSFDGLDGIRFLNLPLFDDLAPSALGREKSGATDPLLAFYLAALDTRQGAIRDILAAMSEAPDGAVMFNCTAGKDRTGIIAALLLGLADVDRADIIADYVLTAQLIPELVAEFLDRSRRRGGDVVAYERMLRSPAETMSAALSSLDRSYGGIADYIAHVGLTPPDVTALRTRLLDLTDPAAPLTDEGR